MKRLGVLTNIDANHGSCVFNFALNDILRRTLPEFNVTFLDYLTPSWYLYEILRALKPHGKIPLYNLERYLRLRHSSYKNLVVEPFFSPFRGQYDRLVKVLIQKKYDILVVGKVVWDIAKIWQTPRFPNIFWLSEKIPSKKIAFAVSGHRTNMERFRQNRDTVQRILSSYSLIGVRDDLTLEMMAEAGVDKSVDVMKIPDPAFYFEPKPTDVSSLLTRFGIDTDRPILGVLFYGKPELARALGHHYRRRGFQMINFNMYHSLVDVNIGHRIDPFEWEQLFRSLAFCVTDRFHGALFCIRNRVPFIAIEPYRPRTLFNSKIYGLLKDFDLLDCYRNTLEPGFRIPDFIQTCAHIETDWQISYSPLVRRKLEDQSIRHKAFIQRIQNLR